MSNEIASPLPLFTPNLTTVTHCHRLLRQRRDTATFQILI